MRNWRFLFVAVLFGFLDCGSAMADNWRDENPNQPNGYAASTFRYHHGTPGGDDGPANGYRATSIRSHNGLEGYMPPSDESSGRWGGGGDSDRWVDYCKTARVVLTASIIRVNDGGFSHNSAAET
ncbi:MAG: hypothetical protein K8F91_26855 [Candidatus Obscuribacterales bacterium]|nr:hypothetical protein [Candidatus Obscuribacterales bacterium]